MKPTDFSTRAPKVLDLFSGIGGFSLGLHRAGFETIAFCEIDKHCQKVLQKNFPNIPIFSDIKELSGEQFKGNVDVVCGGFPCQDISVAGKKKGLIDEEGQTTRSGLWFEYKRLIQEIQPKLVIIENVANMRNIGLARVLKDLWTLGYDAEWHIISARSVGANHLRERIWIIAYPNNARLERSGRPGETCETCTQISFGSSIMQNESSDSDMSRLWRPFTSEEEKQQWWSKATSSFCDWWQTESRICGMDDGLPEQLDRTTRAKRERARKERIKQLGNSVVPQIIELIGRELIKKIS